MSNKNNTYGKHQRTIKALATGICSKRKSKGMSQYKLAERTGITRNCIQQTECYEHLPNLPTIFEIMLVLEFSEEESKEFLWECLNAYREDKERLKEEEKETAGAV